MEQKSRIEVMNELLKKLDELLPVLSLLTKNPASIIMDDVQLREMLKLSKRSTAYLREKGTITYSKIGGKIYYRLSHVLDLIERTKVPCFNC